MIVVVGGIKGGSGKTTVATNLAVLRAAAGRDVLLVDADDQETATDFTALRKTTQPEAARYGSIKLTGKGVREEIPDLQKKYGDIIIDTGGRDTISQRAALIVADVLLVPFVPRSFDVWTLDKVNTLIREARAINGKLQAFAFINRADSQGNDNHGAAEILQEADQLTYLDAAIGLRKVFGNAASLGLAVTEMKSRDSRAIAEIQYLYQCVFEQEAGHGYRQEAS